MFLKNIIYFSKPKLYSLTYNLVFCYSESKPYYFLCLKIVHTHTNGIVKKKKYVSRRRITKKNMLHLPIHCYLKNIGVDRAANNKFNRPKPRTGFYFYFLKYYSKISRIIKRLCFLFRFYYREFMIKKRRLTTPFLN